MNKLKLRKLLTGVLVVILGLFSFPQAKDEIVGGFSTMKGFTTLGVDKLILTGSVLTFADGTWTLGGSSDRVDKAWLDDLDSTTATIATLTISSTATGPLIVNGNIRASIGTAASPSYTFRTDQDTGMWMPASNSLAFSTLGVERLRVNSSGNVGIGTTSPDQLLEISSADTKFIIRSTGSTSSASLDFQPAGGASSSNQGKFTIRAGGLGGSRERLDIINTDDVKLFTIASTGNVGIGTVSPRTKLELLSGTALLGSDGLTVDTLITGASRTITSNQGTLALFANDAVAADIGGTLIFGTRYDATQGFTSAVIKGARENATDTNTASYLAFGTRAAGDGNPLERMRITSTGNVGIGTTAPSSRLEVLGGRLEVGGTASASYLLTGNTLQVGGFASVAYSRFGTATTGHSNYISTTNDLLVSGDLEVDGSVSFAGVASASSRVYFTGLTGASGTPNSACLNSTTKEITENAATSCVVSARDQKDKIKTLNLSGLDIVNKLNPISFVYKDNIERLRYGFVADELQAVNSQLGDAYDKDGNARSIDIPALLAVNTKAIQELNQKVENNQFNPYELQPKQNNWGLFGLVGLFGLLPYFFRRKKYD